MTILCLFLFFLTPPGLTPTVLLVGAAAATGATGALLLPTVRLVAGLLLLLGGALIKFSFQFSVAP